MKGHVEIFTEVDGEKIVLHEESNLIVDGAGEAIVDMLTYTPGLALSSDEDNNTIVERALDTSNFTIQAMTFAKGSVGYKTNLHKYDKHNLIASANELFSISRDTKSGVIVEQLPGKHTYDNISKVYFVSSTDATNGGYFEFSSNVFDKPYLDSLSSVPKVFSIDIKMDLNNPPAPLDSVESQPQFVYPTFDISSGGNRSIMTALFFPPGRSLNNIFVPRGNIFTLIPNGLVSTPGANSAPNALFKELGNGWYRMSCLIPSATTYDASYAFSVKVYPVGGKQFDFGSNSENLDGGMMFARPSLNIGSLPINYFLPDEEITTSSVAFESFQYAPSSIITKEKGIFVPSSLGTITNTARGYNVSASLPATPHPNDIYLEPETSTVYEDCVDVVLPGGHNLNMLQLVNKRDKLITDFVASGWSSKGSGINNVPIQNDFRWFGCFADELDNTAYLVSAINQVGYENNTISRTSSGDRFNSVSSMDYRGYLRAYYYKRGEASDNNSKLLVSALPEFSSTGRVIYTVKINRSDVEMANYFGGIFDLGLYTMNPFSTRVKNEIDLSRSINRDPWKGDDIDYRLFAQKSMNYDITHGDAFDSKDSITINWTIDFL